MNRFWPALLLLAACSAPQTLVPADAGLTCFTSALPGASVLQVGVPTEVFPTLNVFCQGQGSPYLDSLVVEVIGPDERPAPFTARAPETIPSLGSTTMRTGVAFTPDRPGPWTVIARFEPSVGRVQLLFDAVVPRADAGFRLMAIDTFPSECLQFGLLASGTPVCVVPEPTPKLFVGVQVLDGEAFAIDGDAIWLVQRVGSSDARLVRFDPALGTTHRSAPFFFGGAVFAARDGEALTAGMFDAQNVTPRHLTRVRAEPDAGLTFTQHSIGDRFALGLAASPERVLVPAVLTFGGATQTVVFEADGGSAVVQAGTLSAFPGSDDGMAWGEDVRLTSVVTQVLTVLDHDGVRPRVRSSAFLSAPAPLPRLVPQSPVGRFRPDGGDGLNGVLLLDRPALAWELLDPGPGFGPVISATRRHAFARSLDGKTLKVIDR